MPSSETRELPAAWGDPPSTARLWFAVAGLAAIAAVSCVVGIAAASAGNFVGLRYCLLFGLAVALIAVLPVVVRYRRVDLSSSMRTVVRNGAAGTEIRYAFWPFAIIVAVMVCFSAFCLMAAIEIPMYQDEGFPGAAVIAGALGLVFVSFVIAVAAGRIRRGGVTLSSRGIVQRGWSFESSLDWECVAGVTPAYRVSPLILVIGYANADWTRRNTVRFWRMDALPPVPMVVLDGRQFDVDPCQLFSYLQTYVENPAARSELGTEAALVRARRARTG